MRSNCWTAGDGEPVSSWANAIFEYLKIFHNRQRRHTALKMRTPIEYERIHYHNLTVAPLIQMS